MKNVQITQELFLALVKYHLLEILMKVLLRLLLTKVKKLGVSGICI